MSEERELLADAVERVFADRSSRRAAPIEGAELDAELWEQVEALGLPLLLVPEADGGSGGGFQDARVALRALGRHALPIPLAESLLAARALATARIPRPAGPLSLALRTRGELRESRGTWRYTGGLDDVPWGASSAAIAAVLPAADGARLCCLEPRHATSIVTRINLADEPLNRLVFSDAPVESVPSPIELAGDLFDEAALLLTAQICGALDAALSRSLTHANQRKQFGRALAQFQAVQQALAVLGEEVLAVECASEAACRAADRSYAPADRSYAGFEIACARLRANLAIDTAVPIAHQVHGAIGFTREQDLRLFTQRLLAWRGALGNDRYWAERLGQAVAARGAAAFWSDLTRRSDAHTSRKAKPEK
jgi:acyl-CoA dehydrogenase